MAGSPYLLEALALPTRHTAQDEPDGRVRVRGVPIFAENERVRYGKTYDRAWLARAVQIDKANRSIGSYSAPMHFRHHDGGFFGGGSPPERAGDFEVTGARLRYYLGKPLWVVFADLVYKDRATYERGLRDFPYRSVEISPERPDQFSSLALLDSEAPFFQFPNLGAGNVERSAVLAFAAAPAGGDVFLWRGSMDPKAKKDEASPPTQPDEKASAAPGADEAQPEKKAASLDDVLFEIKAVHVLLVKLAEGAGSQDTNTATQGNPGMGPQGRAPVVAASAAKESDMDAKEKAELEGKLAAMSGQIAALTKKASEGERYSALVKSLEGYQLTPAVTDKLRELCGKGEGVGEAFVEAYKLSTPKAPNSAVVLASVGGAGAPAPQRTPEDAAVEKYAADPIQKAKAEHLAHLWKNEPAAQAFKVDSDGKARTLEQFLAANLG